MEPTEVTVIPSVNLRGRIWSEDYTRVAIQFRWEEYEVVRPGELFLCPKDADCLIGDPHGHLVEPPGFVSHLSGCKVERHEDGTVSVGPEILTRRMNFETISRYRIERNQIVYLPEPSRL